ncbi:MAG: FAD-dependent oxidoreductase [Ferruginibacter sp.]
MPEFDLAIIGAGIIGVSAAWYANKQHPEWCIVILDQSTVSSGATYYSASLDLPYGHTPLRYQLAGRSRELFSALREELPALPIKDLSLFGIVQQSKANEVLSQIVDKNASISPEIIPGLQQQYPNLTLPKGATVIAGTASQAYKNDIATLMAEKLIESGVHIQSQSKILSVKPVEGHYKLQTATGNIISTNRVIQATGPWMTEDLIEGTPVSTGTRIKKIVAFHIHQQPEISDALFYFFDDDAFIMPKYEAGYWLFSFKCDHWDVKPDISNLNIDDADIQKAQGILKKYYPAFAPLCTAGRVFCDGYTQNGDPVIMQAGNHENYIIAGAGAGSGFRLAPGIAEKALSLFK